MYGNAPIGEDIEHTTLTSEQQQLLRRDLSHVAARMRDVLPPEFMVGSEITKGHDGPRATVAVHPPVGSVVSADFVPERDESQISADRREDIVYDLAASAALQVKRAMPDDAPSVAQ